MCSFEKGLGAKRHFHGISQLIDASQNGLTRILAIDYVFMGHRIPLHAQIILPMWAFSIAPVVTLPIPCP